MFPEFNTPDQNTIVYWDFLRTHSGTQNSCCNCDVPDLIAVESDDALSTSYLFSPQRTHLLTQWAPLPPCRLWLRDTDANEKREQALKLTSSWPWRNVSLLWVQDSILIIISLIKGAFTPGSLEKLWNKGIFHPCLSVFRQLYERNNHCDDWDKILWSRCQVHLNSEAGCCSEDAIDPTTTNNWLTNCEYIQTLRRVYHVCWLKAF